MPGPARLDLVHKAILLGNIEWKAQALENMRDDPEMMNFTDRGINMLLQEFVKAGKKLTVRNETRQDLLVDPDYPYWYRAKVPVSEFPKGLFVEILLLDHAEEKDPFVKIVSAHRQRS
jgi:hypothetical protein